MMIRGLYVITDSALLPGERLLRHTAAALAGGARLVQYRDKTSDTTRRKSQAQGLHELCTRHQAQLIINDDLELAAELGAGLHLGKDDGSVADARETLGNQAIIGVSCYNRLEQALEAAAAGASYVAFGRFFPSLTKPNAVQAHPDLLTEARASLNLPIVAIGGINADNAHILIEAGADAVAVIDDIFGHHRDNENEVTRAARQYLNLFSRNESEPT
ncbi:MAG: thiamine phosphate synthase [Gammaproteobacteria bacterium]|nr:thiamine phosphate synthase [Gammaproteobacteria bacterium]